MSDFYPEEEDQGNIYGWLIYATAVLLIIACIIKYFQLDLYTG